MNEFNLSQHEQESNSYVNHLDIDWQKSQGIFYTEIKLAESIIKELKLNRESLILDPCCGTGHFLHAAKDLGLTNIYGCDVDSNAISICRNYLSDSNVIVFDSILLPGTDLCRIFGVEKFDAIVGNPPYGKMNIQGEDIADKKLTNFIKESLHNLFVAALIRATELVKPGGLISYIIPKNFLHVSLYRPIRKWFLQNFQILSVVDIGPYFKKVRGEQVILTLKNSPPENNMINLQKLVENKFIELSKINQSFYEDEVVIFENNEDFWIYKKLNGSGNTLKDFCSGYIGRGRSKKPTAITGKDIVKFGFKNRQLQTSGKKIFLQNIYSSESGIIGAFGGELEASETVTVITDDNKQTAMCLLGILHSRLVNYYLYKFCFNNSKLTMHTDPDYITKIPLPKNGLHSSTQLVEMVEKIGKEKYFTSNWFMYFERINNLVADMYDISQNELKHIDSEIRKIQSTKWFSNG